MTKDAVKKKIGVVLLAGGASRRMGQPKQLLAWGQSTVLGHAINQVLEASPIAVNVVVGSKALEITESIKDSDVSVIFNPNWAQGMGTSIAVGVKQIIGEHSDLEGVLIHLCDLPLIDADYLIKMMTTFERPDQIVMTTYDDTQGVPVLFGADYYKELMALAGEEGAKTLLQSHKKRVEKVTFNGPYRDLDTIEAYESLKKEQWS